MKKLLIMDGERPIIPAFVLPAVKELIHQCWKHELQHRPTFNQILDRLEAMKFKLTANVNSSRLSEFVKSINNWEKTNSTPTALTH
jgi:hypothetical protein